MVLTESVLYLRCQIEDVGYDEIPRENGHERYASGSVGVVSYCSVRSGRLSILGWPSLSLGVFGSTESFYDMKLIDAAVVGVRVAGATAIAVGLVLGLTSLVTSVLVRSSLAGGFGSDLHLHDTYYVVSNVHYDLVVPSGVGLVVGVTILLMSRRLGRLLIRGMEGS